MTQATKLIFCQRSGVPLCSITTLCSHGWPLLSSMQTTLCHPVYNFPLERLLLNLKNSLQAAEQTAWCFHDNELRELQLHMSAVMYGLDAIWTPPHGDKFLWDKLEPSLPAEFVAVASGWRLYTLASWYHYGTSKRMEFPKYRVSSLNNNLNWENFKTWLDDAFTVKDEWEKGRTALQQEAELKARSEALKTIHSAEVYKRIDLNKVWNWIEIQLKINNNYPAGRRQTLRSIFMKADLEPQEWLLDDVEDLQEAVLMCCDIGNDIMHFITTRINLIRAAIKDFYGSFTLLGSIDPATAGRQLAQATTLHEKQTTEAFFSPYDTKAALLEQMPPEPKRENYANNALFLQAQAQWRILKRRFDALHNK